MIYVARDALCLARFPVEAIKPQGVVRGAPSILAPLCACTLDIQSLRSGALMADVEIYKTVETASTSVTRVVRAVTRRVAPVQLNGNEEASIVVFNNIKK